MSYAIDLNFIHIEEKDIWNFIKKVKNIVKDPNGEAYNEILKSNIYYLPLTSSL